MRTLSALMALAAVAVTATVEAQSGIQAALHASGFSQPVAIVQDPSNRGTQYVAEQGGLIRVVSNGTVLPTPFLNLSVGSQISAGGERGLLGLVLAPDYAASGRFYVNFTNPAGHTVIARFKRSTGNPLVADAASRFDLKWNGPSGNAYIVQPFANHNGGHVAFGADGYLYIGMGDGGSGNDPANYAQTPTSLLGKMLRVDVSVADNDPIGYRIPADNPFAIDTTLGARQEIWAFGLRNPWRFSFDSPALGGTGALVIGDVGQGAWEEIDYEPAGQGGRNYGWSTREGAHQGVPSNTAAYGPLRDPVHEYDHATGQSITGGLVYRGPRLLPQYRGRYFFADFVAQRIWSLGLTLDGNGEAHGNGLIEHTAALSNLGPLGLISAFGLDADGEILVVSYSRGVIFRIATTILNPPTGLRIVRP